MHLEKALAAYNLTMPPPPAKGGLYEPAVQFSDKLIYLSGCGPNFAGDDEKKFAGKVGIDYTIEEGQDAARRCAVNLLAVLQKKIGDLIKVKHIVKMTVFVACADDFYDQPKVANGASQLLMDVFGEKAGCSSRSAVGTNALPGNIPVEIEMLVEVY